MKCNRLAFSANQLLPLQSGRVALVKIRERASAFRAYSMNNSSSLICDAVIIRFIFLFLRTGIPPLRFALVTSREARRACLHIHARPFLRRVKQIARDHAHSATVVRPGEEIRETSHLSSLLSAPVSPSFASPEFTLPAGCF